MRILVIEDDHLLGSAIVEQIAGDGHRVDWAKRLDDGAAYLGSAEFQLILLDLMLPDGLGLPFLRTLRRGGNDIPVIILTALDQITDRIDGLNAGADDYLVKPFHLAELSARVLAVSRRYAGSPSPFQVYGDLEVDLCQKEIRKNGKPLKLTAREWAVAEGFFLHPEVLFSKAQLEDRLNSFSHEIQSNAVEVYVSRLRKKLGAAHIVTEHGLGYRFVS